MHSILRSLRACTAAGAAVVALVICSVVGNQLPSPPGDSGYWLGIGAFTILLAASALLIGILHGWTFGAGSEGPVTAAASLPVLLWGAYVTIASWFLGAPLLVAAIAFPWIVSRSVRFGAALPGACKYLKESNEA